MPHGAGTGPKGAKIFTVFIIPGNALSDSVLRCVPQAMTAAPASNVPAEVFTAKPSSP